MPPPQPHRGGLHGGGGQDRPCRYSRQPTDRKTDTEDHVINLILINTQNTWTDVKLEHISLKYGKVSAGIK